MRITKEQLRSLIRETVRRKLELGPMLDDWEPRQRVPLTEGSLTTEELQTVIDEEFAYAMAERDLDEEESPPTGEKIERSATTLMRRKGV